VELIVQPNEVNEVSYMSPKAGADKTWVPNASFVTAVAGLGCGVGYYKYAALVRFNSTMLNGSDGGRDSAAVWPPQRK
jgi:hypothetical protein